MGEGNREISSLVLYTVKINLELFFELFVYLVDILRKIKFKSEDFEAIKTFRELTIKVSFPNKILILLKLPRNKRFSTYRIQNESSVVIKIGMKVSKCSSCQRVETLKSCQDFHDIKAKKLENFSSIASNNLDILEYKNGLFLYNYTINSVNIAFFFKDNFLFPSPFVSI